MFGGLNVKSTKSSSSSSGGNTDDTSSASKQSATSAFSFLNATTTAPVSVSESSPSNSRTTTSDEGSGGVAHEQQQQRQNESSAFTFLNSSTKAEAAVASVPIPSSSFSFMNAAVGEDDVPAVAVEPSKASEKSGGIGNGLFDQLNMNTAPLTTTATTSVTMNSSALSSSDVSQPSMSLNSITQASVKIKPASSTKSSGVTRKKKRSVKIGVAASNADEGGSTVKANDTGSASSTKSEDALEQSMKDDTDDVVQRAEAAAKLAMQIEEDT